MINGLYARDVLGLSEEQWYFVFIPLLPTMVVASLPIGKMVESRRKIPLILGLGVFGLATMVCGFGFGGGLNPNARGLPLYEKPFDEP